MNRVCVRLAQANSASLNSTPAPPQAARASYASVAANSAAFPAPSNEPSKMITLPRGNDFPIRSSKVLIICPSSDAEAKFISSNATKEALLKAGDPVALKLKVQGIRAGPNHSIVVESDTADCATLSKCTELAKCGLEVKPCAKLLPRVIIHDIPVKMSGDEIVNCILNQNLPHASIEDVKLVYLYPAARKKTRSCVVELKAEHRLELMKRRG